MYNIMMYLDKEKAITDMHWLNARCGKNVYRLITYNRWP